MRHWLALSLPLSFPVVFPSLASAQEFQSRFWNDSEPRPQRSKYFRLAQVDSPTSPRAAEPAAPGPVAAPENPELAAATPARRGRKPITVNVDTRFGFDSAKVFVPATVPFEVSVKRRIRTIVVSGSYPVAPRTRLSVNVPYISQSTKNSAGGQTLRQRGNGIGDVSIWVDHTIPRLKQ
ncbi:hypothetical protein EON80_17055, partial [bacterium]